jgi:hypothetical protein
MDRDDTASGYPIAYFEIAGPDSAALAESIRLSLAGE